MPTPSTLLARVALGLVVYLTGSLAGALLVGRFLRVGKGTDLDHELPEGRS